MISIYMAMNGTFRFWKGQLKFNTNAATAAAYL